MHRKVTGDERTTRGRHVWRVRRVSNAEWTVCAAFGNSVAVLAGPVRRDRFGTELLAASSSVGATVVVVAVGISGGDGTRVSGSGNGGNGTSLWWHSGMATGSASKTTDFFPSATIVICVDNNDMHNYYRYRVILTLYKRVENDNRSHSHWPMFGGTSREYFFANLYILNRTGIVLDRVIISFWTLAQTKMKNLQKNFHRNEKLRQLLRPTLQWRSYWRTTRVWRSRCSFYSESGMGEGNNLLATITGDNLSQWSRIKFWLGYDVSKRIYLSPCYFLYR